LKGEVAVTKCFRTTERKGGRGREFKQSKAYRLDRGKPALQSNLKKIKAGGGGEVKRGKESKGRIVKGRSL